MEQLPYFRGKLNSWDMFMKHFHFSLSICTYMTVRNENILRFKLFRKPSCVDVASCFNFQHNKSTSDPTKFHILLKVFYIYTIIIIVIIILIKR
jgi:hypothetical protein